MVYYMHSMYIYVFVYAKKIWAIVEDIFASMLTYISGVLFD